MSRLIKHSALPTFPTRADKEDWMLAPHLHHNGMWMPMHQLSQYGETLVSNSIDELDLVGEAVGSTTLDGGHFSYRGKMLMTKTMGYWSKTDNNTLWLRVRINTVDAVTCTFQNTGDTITIVGHGITAVTADNMDCTFPSLSASFGLSINTVYYVKYVSADTFQVSATRTSAAARRDPDVTGAAIAITADGTGTVQFSTIIHRKLFEAARLGNNATRGGHFEITTMTTAMTLGTLGTLNMHGDLILKEGDSAEVEGLHSENLILGFNTLVPLKILTTAQWSIARTTSKITSTNYMIM